jgi:hypothetical protein
LTACAGLYHSEQTDALLDLTLRNGALVLNGAALVPNAPRSFTTASGQTSYRFDDSAGEDRTLTVSSENATTRFQAKPRAKPGSTALAAYGGSYFSDELDVSVTISVRDGRLTLTRWPHPPMSGTPTFDDGFWFGGAWHVTFRRGNGGEITSAAFTHASGRCRNVSFERR